MLGPAGGVGCLWSVSNCSSGGPAKGALMSTREPNTSGRTSAHHAATAAPKSCPTTCCRAAIAEGERKSQCVAHCVQETKGSKVRIIISAPTCRAAVAAQVRGDNIKARGGQGRHEFAPGIGDFRKAVQHQHQWAIRTIETGLRMCTLSPLMPSTNRERVPRRQYGGVQRSH